MRVRIRSALFASVAIALVSLGCTIASAGEAPNPAPKGGDGAQPVQLGALGLTALGECARPDIVLGEPLQTSAVDRATAQTAAQVIGVRGDAAVGVLATVTIGTRTGFAPTTADALIDARGVAIVNRPAWVFVFRNQAVKFPSNGVYMPGTRPNPPPLMSAMAGIVDAQTGHFLRGWGCAFKQ